MSEKVQIRLWDSQWMNIINADYSGLSLEDALNLAIKKTEEAMASNSMRESWPPGDENGERP